ncbi:MAG: 2-oxoacid:acceptor oxidoreductase subunit alpha [Desulfovibrionaceae bacterium]
MSTARTNIVIGGGAGQGLVTVSHLFAKSLVRAGYDICCTQDYMSRVRGGHNFMAIRVGRGVAAPTETIDLLVAMNAETVALHRPELAPGALVLLDASIACQGAGCTPVPFKAFAPKPIFENMAALGVLAALMGIDIRVPAGLVADTLGKKGAAVVAQNETVLEAAYAWVAERSLPFSPPAPVRDPKADPRLMLHGNEALGLGCLAGGVKFCAFYPMTPATTIPQQLIAARHAMGVLVEQVEDEIAAINMAVGAAVGGARAMVATSGGGFALMTEGVSLAGVMETPVVVALAQRPGPATGMATRTEQADLDLALYAGHGEFPRAIFAPGDVEASFHLARRAFDVADRFQTPAFVLTDQWLADCYRAVPPFDLSEPPRRAFSPDSLGDPASYASYAMTDSGVSPRAVPGEGAHLVMADSHEHTPAGVVVEGKENRAMMMEKRARKEDGLRAEAMAPTLDGPRDADVLLVCWGSTMGAAREAAALLRDQGVPAAVLHFSQVWPLKPDDWLPILHAAQTVVAVEGNFQGQFADLIRRVTGFVCHQRILRYDGRPISPTYILDRLAG